MRELLASREGLLNRGGSEAGGRWETGLVKRGVRKSTGRREAWYRWKWEGGEPWAGGLQL